MARRLKQQTAPCCRGLPEKARTPGACAQFASGYMKCGQQGSICLRVVGGEAWGSYRESWFGAPEAGLQHRGRPSSPLSRKSRAAEDGRWACLRTQPVERLPGFLQMLRNLKQ